MTNIWKIKFRFQTYCTFPVSILHTSHVTKRIDIYIFQIVTPIINITQPNFFCLHFL